MPSLIRGLAATAMLSLLVLGLGASSVAAASPLAGAELSARYEFDDEWCFDYGTTYDCTVVDAALIVTSTPDGREIARITVQEVVTSFSADGTEIGSYRTSSLDRTVFADGGQDSTFSVSHTRAVGEFGSCVSTYLLKIVDYELQVDRYVGPGC